MTEDLPFPKPEPRKFRPELWNMKQTSISHGQQKRNTMTTSISVGDVAKEFKLDSMVVGDVIYLNIKNVAMLNTESV